MNTTVINQEQDLKMLGQVIMEAFGNDKPLSWLADRTFVTQSAVSKWLKGICRPKPHRLGRIAAMLKIDPYEVADLAGYTSDTDAMILLLTSYYEWHDRGDVNKLALCKNLLTELENIFDDLGYPGLKEEFRERRPELILALLNTDA